MRTHPADLVERNFPIFQRRISNEFLPASVVDRLNFGHNKRGSFRELCHQVLQLSDARQVIVLRAILRQLQRSEVINALDLQIELLLKLEDLRQRLRRFGDATLPLRDSRISPRNPLYVPATKPIQSIIIRTSGWFCAMPFAGPQAMAQNGSTVARKSPPKTRPNRLRLKAPKFTKKTRQASADSRRISYGRRKNTNPCRYSGFRQVGSDAFVLGCRQVE